MPAQENWIRIAANRQELFEEGFGRIVERRVNGQLICVVPDRDKLWAFVGKCPHAGGHLSEGFIDGKGNIVCPVHGYRFRLSNGYNSSGEGFYLKTYPVLENTEGVFVSLPDVSGLL